MAFAWPEVNTVVQKGTNLLSPKWGLGNSFRGEPADAVAVSNLLSLSGLLSPTDSNT